MTKPTLFSTHPLFEEPRRKIAERFDVEYWTAPGRPPRDELLWRVAGKDALICLLTETIDAELLAAASRLRMVANVAVGFDNIDLQACTRQKVAVSNTPGVLDETTADFAWTLLLAVARRLLEGDALARSGQWQDLRRRRVGENAGHSGLWPHRASGSAAGTRLRDAHRLQ